MICSVCGTRNPADAAFCSHCGTALQKEAVTGETVRIPTPPTGEEEAAGARVYQTPNTPLYNQPSPTYPGPQQSGTALLALVLGIVSFFGPLVLTAIPAILIGRNARNEIRASNGQLTGEGMAQAGIVLGWITIGLSVLGFCAFCALFAAQFAVLSR